MKTPFTARFFAFLILGLAAASAAQAQTRPDAAPAPRSGESRRAPKPAPAPTTLEGLFEQLRASRSAGEAKIIANQIERRWLRSGSETADLLMGRVVQAMTAKDHATALDLIDHIVLTSPDWAEPYNRRATILFLMDDYDGALREIRATLAREPRHFGALAGLGMIMHRMEQTKAAYAAFSRALAIHPHLEQIKETVERLKIDVEDRKI